jgi:hypothetical protein
VYRDRAAVLVEHASRHLDPLAHRLARVLACQIVVRIANRIVAIHRASGAS